MRTIPSNSILVLNLSIQMAKIPQAAKLGSPPSIREVIYEVTPSYCIDFVARQARLACRTFLRHCGVYLAATGILSLGLGMSIAMFSLIDAVLIRPLPFPNQERIQVIWKTDPSSGTHIEELAYPELRDFQEGIRGLQYVAVMPTSLYGYAKVLQKDSADPVQIESAPVSHDFFRVLGVSPALGRDFKSSDEQVGAAPVVIVSDRVWRDEFAADRNIVGQIVRLNGQGHTVIGAMAPGVEFPRGVGLWVPLGVEQRIVERRGATFLQAIARMKTGQSREQITRDVNALLGRLAMDHPEVYSRSQRGIVTPLVEYWTGSARLHLWIMLAASLLLSLAAIISSANLLLSRTLSRRTEIATRLALGAGRRQILWELAAEGILVAAVAVVAGVAIARSAIWLLTRSPSVDIPRLADATLDLRALCFASAAAFAAAAACSILPGCSAMRMPLESALREGGARLSISSRGRHTRSVFLTTQAAVTVTLLGLAALLFLSYRSMVRAETGFSNRETLSMNLALRGPGLFPGQAFSPQVRRSIYERLLTRLRESSGVTSAGAILLRPLEGTIGWDVSYDFDFEAHNATDRRVLPKANYEVVTPGYFQTVGTALLEGRDFNRQDSENAEKVVIINRRLAQRISATGHVPLGYRVRLGLGDWARIIGICADARYRNVAEIGNDLFVPSSQANAPTNYLVIRGTQPARQIVALVRRVLAAIDPTQTISEVATIGELIDSNSARHRFNMFVLLWFGICASILAATGVYSVIAETLAARRQEIAIKTALGSQRIRLVREMVSSTVSFVLIGEVLGIGCTAALGSFASDLLYGVSPRDPIVLTSVGIFLFIVSLVAASWPAWLSAGNDPMSTLQSN